MIDCLVFDAVPAVFQSCNGDKWVQKYQSHQHSSSYFGSKAVDLCKFSIYVTLFISYHSGSVLTSTITKTWQILKNHSNFANVYVY